MAEKAESFDDLNAAARQSITDLERCDLQARTAALARRFEEILQRRFLLRAWEAEQAVLREERLRRRRLMGSVDRPNASKTR